MENFFKESLILSSIYRFWLLIQSKFKQGFIYSFFQGLADFFKHLVDYSKFWTYFKAQDPLDRLFESSLLIRSLGFLINLPIKILRKAYLAFQGPIEASLIYRLLTFLADRIVGLIGLILVFTMIVPDHRWYNIYTVILTGGLLLIYLFKAISQEGFSLRLERMDPSFVIFIGLIFISGLMSIFFKYSLNDLVFYILIFINLLILISSVKSSKDLEILNHFIVIGASLTALYGIYQWKVVGIEINPSLTDLSVNQGMGGRVFSTMGNPNIYGELLVLTMPFFMAAILNSKNLLVRLGYLLAYLVSLVVLLKTGSRSAWVAFAFASLSFVYFKDKRLLPIFMLLGVGLIPFLPNSIYRRLMTIVNPNDSSLQYRKAILEPAMPMLKDYWFTGVGLGSKAFNTIYKRYKNFTLKTVAHTHNLFLQIWLESGIVALISFLWLGFRMVKKTSYLINNSKDKKLINIAIAAMSAIAGVVVMGFADHIWFYNRILYIFWFIASLVFLAYNLETKKD